MSVDWDRNRWGVMFALVVLELTPMHGVEQLDKWVDCTPVCGSLG